LLGGFRRSPKCGGFSKAALFEDMVAECPQQLELLGLKEVDLG
jgi:hypothetical protein